MAIHRPDITSRATPPQENASEIDHLMLHNPETIYRKEGDSFEKKNASVFKKWRNKFSAVFLADFHDKM